LGLSIDRRITWRGWMTTWRLLAVTMPLSIAAAAWLGWAVVGLAPAAAILLGAALAPTDPVLAGDVQTGPPSTGDPDADEPDEVRFGLTSESSLNDGLAFPFVNLAILVAAFGFATEPWLWQWLLVDVLYKVFGGLVYGWVVGKGLGWITIRLVGSTGSSGRLDEDARLAPALMALTYTLLSFGITEVLGAYGFIAVFVTAYVVRDTERVNHVHDHLHQGAEQLELFAMSVVLIALGASFADGLYEHVTWPMIDFALAFLLVVRPLAGWLGLAGNRNTTPAERAAVAFFGIRGLGSIYYLAYGLNHTELIATETLWALTAVTIFTSLAIHGLTARPAMARLEHHRAATAAANGGPASAPRDGT
ncbi:MAG: cation:proton antiporter, partial [Actinomycetota bacterium]